MRKIGKPALILFLLLLSGAIVKVKMAQRQDAALTQHTIEPAERMKAQMAKEKQGK